MLVTKKRQKKPNSNDAQKMYSKYRISKHLNLLAAIKIAKINFLQNITARAV